jgi:GNAT superfamily N-acetyltransferase
MGLRIRTATAKDAEPISLLTRELGYPAEPRATRERLRRILRRKDQRVLVAEFPDGRICGWLQAHCSEALESGFRVEIIGLIVSGAMRRRGVGRRLVSRAEAWASEISADGVVVRSNTARVESHAFYPSLGYRKVKIQAVYRKPARV